MADFSNPMLFAIAATFLAAGFVKGVTGMGPPTVAMAVLGARVSPLAAAGRLVIPSLVTSIRQFLARPARSAVLRRLWSMMLAIFAGMALSAGLLVGGETEATTTALGLALVACSIYTIFARQLRAPRQLEPWLSPIVGAATGLVTGGTGILGSGLIART
ncbi:sulfite exporter TauE/SafE family protein [Sinisalibacter aestuarii]|nr:sulfite exporter TauE/SafE family protein [Sinisalibacter aestuarii]